LRGGIVQLKEFFKIENFYDFGKLANDLDKKKVAFTVLARAVETTDWIVKRHIRDFKKQEIKNDSTEQNNLSAEVGRLEKIVQHNSTFAEAMKKHVSMWFDKYVDKFNLKYEIPLIDVTGINGDYFIVSFDVCSKDNETETYHFVEDVNFNIDFQERVILWASFLDVDFIDHRE